MDPNPVEQLIKDWQQLMLFNTMLTVWHKEHAWFEVLGHGGMLLEFIILKEKTFLDILEIDRKQADERRRNLSRIISSNLVIKEHRDLLLWVMHKLTDRKTYSIKLSGSRYTGCQLIGAAFGWANRRTRANTVLSSLFHRSALQLPLPQHQRQKREAKPGADTKWKLSVHKSHINPIEFHNMIDSGDSAD